MMKSYHKKSDFYEKGFMPSVEIVCTRGSLMGSSWVHLHSNAQVARKYPHTIRNLFTRFPAPHTVYKEKISSFPQKIALL